MVSSCAIRNPLRYFLMDGGRPDSYAVKMGYKQIFRFDAISHDSTVMRGLRPLRRQI